MQLVRGSTPSISDSKDARKTPRRLVGGRRVSADPANKPRRKRTISFARQPPQRIITIVKVLEEHPVTRPLSQLTNLGPQIHPCPIPQHILHHASRDTPNKSRFAVRVRANICITSFLACFQISTSDTETPFPTAVALTCCLISLVPK